MTAAEDSSPLSNRFVRWVAVLAMVYGTVWFFYARPELSSNRTAQELFVWPLTLILLTSYWLGFRILQKESISLRWLIVGGSMLAVIAALIPPFHSTDLYGYINRGWQQWHYGMNPYVHTVDHIPGWELDPMITNHWVNNPSPYGFVYLLVAKALCALGGGAKAQTILVFKGFNVLVHALMATLVWLGVKRLHNKEAAKLALYLYAFNPLVLIHGLANGHNDMFMGFFVLLSAYFALVGAWIGILPALMAATLVKYGALVIIPFAILLLIKQRQWRGLVLGGLLAGLLFGLCGLPYFADWQAFHLKEIGRNALVSHGSLHSCVYSALKAGMSSIWPQVATMRHWGHTMAETQLLNAKLTLRDGLKNLLLVGYAIFYVRLAWQRLRQAQYSQVAWVQDALLVMALLVLLISLKCYPWYLGMFFPLAFYLDAGNPLRQLLLWISGAQLFSITFIGQAHVLNFWVMTGLPVLAFWWLQRQQHSAGILTKSARTSEASA